MTKIFKCRASGAGQIMTEPRTKTKDENRNLLLSETCKKFLRKQWVSETYHRHKEITTDSMLKGILNEEQGITMLALHLGMMLKKNEHRFENTHLQGVPDVPHDEIVYDIKCSTDIFTFAECNVTNDNEWQMISYMDLLGLKQSAVVYVLTDTPEEIIHNQVRSILWKTAEKSEPGEARYDEIFKGLKKELTYPDIPSKDRIKIFPVEYDGAKIEALYKRVELSQEFYRNLTL